MHLRCLVTAALLASSLAARADILYSLQSQTLAGQPVDFSFTEPNLLTAATTVPAADLDVTVEPGPTCSVSSFSIGNPTASSVSLTIDFSGSGSGCAYSYVGYMLPGPFDQDGVYTNGAQVPTTLTISGSPAAPTVTPEPSSIALLGTGLLGVAGVVRRRFV